MNYIPLAIPNMSEAEATNLQKCIDDNFVSSVGQFVTSFESEVAALSGNQHGVAMGSGTQALHMALHCLGIGAGDLVILPSFTFIASANAISHTGAKPWLFDIEPTSWTIDVDQISEALEQKCRRSAGGNLELIETGERVAAIMPVYTLGTPANMDQLRRLSETYNIPIVADAAAAIGVAYRGQPIGALADLTCYSFNGNKTITCGGGGLVSGDNVALMERIKHVSSTARVTKNYDHDQVGYNYRMTNLQAAVGAAQLGRLQDFLKTKRRIRARYDAAFSAIDNVSIFPSPEDRGSTNWFSGLVLESAASLNPGDLCEALGRMNIEARPFWKPVHLQQPYQDAPTESQDYTESIWHRIVTLPCSTDLTVEDQDRVIEAVKTILSTS